MTAHSQSSALRTFLPVLIFVIAMTPALLWGQIITATVPVGSGPHGIAINPVTNQIYIANWAGETVTAIDGATNATTTIEVGRVPQALAVNAVTNKVYVVNCGGSGTISGGSSVCGGSGIGRVAVIDGATNAVTQVTVGKSPEAVAVNPVTNMIYVANSGDNTVTVLDGVNNATSSVPVGATPRAMAVNMVTNKIYVADDNGGSVTVIDGATHATATVTVGTAPNKLVVNPVTNKIYVTNQSTNNVTVIDGKTNATTTVAAGARPFSVAVNPVTNKVYVTNVNGNSVTIIDGSTNATSKVTTGSGPHAVAIDELSNQVYVTNFNDKTATVIDGLTAATHLVSGLGDELDTVAVNPVTHKVYFVSRKLNTVYVVDAADNKTSSISTGPSSWSVAVNPATNKTYIVNQDDNTVTVFDGRTGAVATVPVGVFPEGVVVNPVTNKVYVGNGDSVTEIDGKTNATTTIATDPRSESCCLAVNPVTNRIYVANLSGSTVTVIDGATRTTSTIAVGRAPYALAVNPVTNKIYVANSGSNNVSVIDGATGTSVTLPAGSEPLAIAVNSVTNKVYVANWDGDSVTVIDGATGASTTLPTGDSPQAVAVNPLTNRIYVAGSPMTVIDGLTNRTTTLPAGAGRGLAVNLGDNKVYATSGGINIIDGSTNAFTSVNPGLPNLVAVDTNEITGAAYVASWWGANTAIKVTPNRLPDLPFGITLAGVTDSDTVSGLAIFGTNSWSPSFTATATSSFSPTAPVAAAVYYQLDSRVGTWQAATLSGGTGLNPAHYTFALSNVAAGVHTVYAFATYGADSTTDNSSDGSGNAAAVSSIAGYTFAVLAPPAGMTSPVPGSTLTGSTTKFVWSDGGGGATYALLVGSTPGASDIANVDAGTALTATVTGIPMFGVHLYVTLNTTRGANTQSSAFTYLEAGTPAKAQITSPPNGTTLTGSSVTFTWTSGTGVTNYGLDVGTTAGGSDLASLTTTNLSSTVTGLPMDGSKLYVRLRSLIDGAWQYNDYAYTAAGAGVITTPAPGSKLTSSSATFTWTGAPAGATFTLLVGKTAGASDIANINAGTATSATVTGIPTDGVHFYVKLITMFSGKTFSNSYSFIEAGTPVKAAMLTPAPNSTLGKNITFTWSKGTGVTNYKFDLGTTAGARDFLSVTTTSLSTTISYLPMTGETVYARLSSFIDGAWQYNDYTYTAISAATLTSPTPGSTISGTSATFTWTKPTGATGYRIGVGTGPLGFDLADIHTGLTTATVDNLPTDGRMLYVTLVTEIAKNSYRNMYTFTASGTAAKGEITSPAPGGKLPDSTVTFQWTGSGVTFYSLYIGSKKGSGDLATIMVGRPTSYTVNNLPTDNRTLYVTLLSLIHGVTQYSYYTYTAADPPQAAMITPTQGTKFDSTSATFTWTPGRNVLGVWLYVGTRHGDSDIARLLASKKTSLTVDNLPSDGRLLYVTLISWINGVPLYNHYTYIAKGTPAKAEMTSPAPNSTLSGSSATFQWTTGTGVTSYTLLLGTTPARAELSRQVLGTATSYTATGLPTDGSTIYATLVSYIDGVGQYTVYKYTAASSATANNGLSRLAANSQ